MRKFYSAKNCGLTLKMCRCRNGKRSSQPWLESFHSTCFSSMNLSHILTHQCDGCSVNIVTGRLSTDSCRVSRERSLWEAWPGLCLYVYVWLPWWWLWAVYRWVVFPHNFIRSNVCIFVSKNCPHLWFCLLASITLYLYLHLYLHCYCYCVF